MLQRSHVSWTNEMISCVVGLVPQSFPPTHEWDHSECDFAVYSNTCIQHKGLNYQYNSIVDWGKRKGIIWLTDGTYGGEVSFFNTLEAKNGLDLASQDLTIF